MPGSKRHLTLSFNSPVVLSFALLCLLALVLGVLLFSVYRTSLLDPFTYLRFFGHVLGHANWAHFMGNLTLLLVLGPLLEEKYGSGNILFVILSTALVTGVVHFLLFPGVHLLGASGAGGDHPPDLPVGGSDLHRWAGL